MTFGARISKLEAKSAPPNGTFRRRVICDVRQWNIEADYGAALQAAGLQEADGDLVKLVLHECDRSNPEPRDPGFVPRIVSVMPLGAVSGR